MAEAPVDEIWDHIKPIHDITFTHTLDKKFSVAVHKPVTYPSEWFANNPKKKPLFKVIAVTKDELAQLNQTVSVNFFVREISIDLLTAFVFYNMLKYPAKLETKWESFGRVIGDANQEITISDLVEVKTEGSPGNRLTHGSEKVPEEEIFGLIIAICSLYRITQATVADYKIALTRRVDDLIKKRMQTTNLALTVDKYGSISTDPWYPTLMAMMDMFLQEFPKHKLAEARFGTIVSRFKDCSALLSTRYICELTGMNLPQLSMWVFNEQVGRQMWAVCRNDQECDNSRSYMMYFVDLKLSDKSPFSAASNPHLHMFYHTIGVTLNQERSRNARLVGTMDFSTVTFNGGLVGYAYSKCGQLTPYAGVDGQNETDELNQEEESEGVTLVSEPQTRNPILWRIYIMKRHGIPPKNILEFATLIWKASENCRENSIGQFLYKQGINWLNTHQLT